MLRILQPSYIFAIAVIIFSIAMLVYFSWKTLITANFFEKGVNLYQEKDYQGAEAAFRKVISLNSTNDVVRLLLGDVLMQQGNLKEATEMFDEVTRSSPKNADAYLRLSHALMQQEKQAEAIVNLQKARDLFQTQRQPQKAENITQLLAEMNVKSS